MWSRKNVCLQNAEEGGKIINISLAFLREFGESAEIIVIVDALADENRKLLCPACRRSAQVPNHGFPVCVLTEHLRDILSRAGGTITAGPLSEEETVNEGSSES